MNFKKGTSDNHFWIDDHLIDLLLLEREVQKTANGRIIHDINLSLSNLKHTARELRKGGTDFSESQTRWALGFLFRWGVAVPFELTDVRDKRLFGTYLFPLSEELRREIWPPKNPK